MTIFEKRRHISVFGIILPLFLLSVAAFGDSIGQQSVFQDAKLRSMFFLFGAAMFSAVVLWLREENTQLESYRMAAITDPLTSLLNRRGMERAFARLISPFLRQGHDANPVQSIEVSVIYIDADRFKQINDTAGHTAGDWVIIAIANLIQSIFKRADEVVVRHGGDEFLVILMHSGTKQAEERARVLLAASKASDEFRRIKARYGVPLALSIGVASGTIPSNVSMKQADGIVNIISQYAEKSMYEAKGVGGNDVGIWGPVAIEAMKDVLSGWPEMSPGIMDRQE
jgi:diguanylate cyclase (GGDEF)-like protein